MPVIINNQTKPGDLYVKEDTLEIYAVDSFFTTPSAVLKNIKTGATTGGGQGCLNLDKFKPLSNCTLEELKRVIEISAKKKVR